ncbi:FAD-dependent oxidoreductase [Streptomyces sp. NPDC056480]|uniref:FAD-dependent oxidoreductase n=1 Tax=Streptomyces sp. NPDC056480 TaxID=3345833 RepID=UPI00369710D3
MSAQVTAGIQYSSFSGWIDRPSDHAPALEGQVDADVVVVGGGYLGMGTALRLAERGIDVALLDSRFCGWGAASRNAGHLTNTLAGDAQMLAALHPRRLRKAIRFADASVEFSNGLIERHGIECDYERTGNVIAAVTEGQLKRSRHNAGILVEAGADAEFVDGREFGLPDAFLGALLADRLAGDDPHEDLQTLWRRRPWFSPSPASSATAVRAAWAVDRLSDRRGRREG